MNVEEMLYYVLRNSEKDANRLSELTKFMQSMSTSQVSLVLTKRVVQALGAVISNCSKSKNLESNSLDAILDAFAFIVRHARDQLNRNNAGNELGDLILKLLTLVERSNSFQSIFCRLLPLIGSLCSCNANTWRQFARPLFNVFVNKKFECSRLEKALAEFANISRSVNGEELVGFARQNLHVLRGFSMLAQRIGDFVTQKIILELVFVCVRNDRALAKDFFAPRNQLLNELIEKFEYKQFENHSRLFLNALNTSLGPKKRVVTINCSTVYFGGIRVEPPAGAPGIWLDVNKDRQRLSIFCCDFLSKSATSRRGIVLQLSLGEVRKLRDECDELPSEESHCMTLTFIKLRERFKVAKSNVVICVASTKNNAKETILEFRDSLKEFSDYVRVGAKKTSELFDSCESIAIDDKIDSKCGTVSNDSQISSRVSCTSPIVLQTCHNDANLETSASGYICENGGQTAGEANLQVHQISSSMRDSQNAAVHQKSDGTRGGKDDKGLGERETRRGICQEIYDEWGNSSEDYISTQEFVTPADAAKTPKNAVVEDANFHKSNGVATLPKIDSAPAAKTFAEIPSGPPVRKLKSRRKAVPEEEASKASLLDPNGYSYKRWKMPGTSERSSFWLRKLKEPEKATETEDAFEFVAEGDSDESDIFVRTPRWKRNKTGSKAKSGQKLPEKARKKANILGKTASKRKYDWMGKDAASTKGGNVNGIRNEGFVECAGAEDNPAEVDQGREEFFRTRWLRDRRWPGDEELLNRIEHFTSYASGEELDEIAERVAEGMDRFARSFLTRDAVNVGKYLRAADDAIARLLEAETEGRKRHKRLEMCGVYFEEGVCCGSDADDDAWREIDRLREIGERGMGKARTRDAKRFMERLNRSLRLNVEAFTKKCAKEFKIRLIELLYPRTM